MLFNNIINLQNFIKLIFLSNSFFLDGNNFPLLIKRPRITKTGDISLMRPSGKKLMSTRSSPRNVAGSAKHSAFQIKKYQPRKLKFFYSFKNFCPSEFSIWFSITIFLNLDLTSKLFEFSMLGSKFKVGRLNDFTSKCKRTPENPS